MKYISNGFSPKMLNPKTNPTFQLSESSYDEIQKEKNELISSIGHQNIAEHLNVDKNRINIQLELGDILYIVNISHIDGVEQYNYKKIIITG